MVFTPWTIPFFLGFASFACIWHCKGKCEWSPGRGLLKNQNPMQMSMKGISLTLTFKNFSINSCCVYCSVTCWLIGRPRLVITKTNKYTVHWPRKTQAHLLLVTDHHNSVYPISARPDEKDTITIPVKEFASVFDLNQPWQWKCTRLCRWSLSGKNIDLPAIRRRVIVTRISIQG